MRNRIKFAQQFAGLKKRYPNSHGKLLRNGFEWYCSLTTSPLSDTYLVCIRYKEPHFPKVYVVSPKHLPLASGAKCLPHVYNTKTQQLCLFWPKKNEWDSSMSIADTIVHWTLQWLIYYEFWRVTGTWFGGGHGDWNAPKIEADCINV